MKTYYIYHISGVKIGCTDNIPRRMKDQGFTSWEILEEHFDIHEASDREIELQKQHGYPVDTVPYWKSVQAMHKMTTAAHTHEASSKRSQSLKGTSNAKGFKHTEEHKLKVSESMKGNTYGKALKGIPKSEEHKRKIRESWAKRKGSHF